MSSYDAAIILDNTTLNKGMDQLFKLPSAKKLFAGTQDVGSLGIKSVDWRFDAVPSFILAPPSTKIYGDKNTFFPSGRKHPAKPAANMCQVSLPKFTVVLHLKAGGTKTLVFSPTVFAQITVEAEKVQLGTVGVYPGEVTPAGKLYLQVIMQLIYTKLRKLLAGYRLPSTLNIEGMAFTTPAVALSAGHLVIASNLKAQGTPDLSGVSWPVQKLAVLASRNLLNALVNKYRAGLIQNIDNASIKHSDSNWAGSYTIEGGISNASFGLDSQMPNIDVSLAAAATVSIDVSWWLVPTACAIEAASNWLSWAD